MLRSLPRWVSGSLLLITLGGLGLAQQPTTAENKPADPDLTGYRTAGTAITTQISRAAPTRTAGSAAYLGVHVVQNDDGKLSVAELSQDSPAAKAGIRQGDLLLKVEGQTVASSDALRELMRSKHPGDEVHIALLREGKPLEVNATFTALSRPVNLSAQRAILGVQVTEPKEGAGVQITTVESNTPAAKAKLKEGEVILKIDDVPLTNNDKLRDFLIEKKPGDTVTLTLLLAEKAVEMKVKLDAESGEARGGGRGGFGGTGGFPGMGGGGGGFDTRGGNYWTKDTFKLAMVLIEYPDVKHNPKVPAKAWEDAMFSRGTYKTTATGQSAYGSMADYYHEQSYGKLKVEGKAFEYIEVSKKRAEYGEGNNRFALLTEALDKLLERDGKDALKDFDGINFIYAGGRMNVARGSLYWPHRSSVSHQGKRWPYFICQEGGDRMGNTSVFCHEFGHMLGLPDLYARPENPGSEGVGTWCAMSQQAGNGKPQHFSAWCKEKLNWIKPAVIDPTVPQKLILAPIEDSEKECFKVLIRPDGSEYLLLENRKRKGFDESLAAEGLLIWRVVRNRPILEESHGVEGPAGPRVFMTSVPYPSAANDAFTPFTTPSSRSQLGGGLPVNITNIRKLPDGRIAFCIGYEYE
jgi:M6 family metalloprotease-like protein